MVVLPKNPQDIEKTYRYISAYVNSYTLGEFKELSFPGNDTDFEKENQVFTSWKKSEAVIHPNSTLVEKIIKRSWNLRVYTPKETLAYCFSRAGFHDKHKDDESGKWLDCLQEIASTSKMTYNGDTSEKEATQAALDLIKSLDQNKSDFAAELTCLKYETEQAWHAGLNL